MWSAKRGGRKGGELKIYHEFGRAVRPYTTASTEEIRLVGEAVEGASHHVMFRSLRDDLGIKPRKAVRLAGRFRDHPPRFDRTGDIGGEG